MFAFKKKNTTNKGEEEQERLFTSEQFEKKMRESKGKKYEKKYGRIGKVICLTVSLIMLIIFLVVFISYTFFVGGHQVILTNSENICIISTGNHQLSM
jgi:hypothetical protein